MGDKSPKAKEKTRKQAASTKDKKKAQSAATAEAGVSLGVAKKAK
jgi:hypothetical protein